MVAKCIVHMHITAELKNLMTFLFTAVVQPEVLQRR